MHPFQKVSVIDQFDDLLLRSLVELMTVKADGAVF